MQSTLATRRNEAEICIPGETEGPEFWLGTAVMIVELDGYATTLQPAH